MKRYKRFVLEAANDIEFVVSKGTNDDVIIRASKILTPKVYIPNVYSTNYSSPPIPEGYKHIDGDWNNGFVIERYSDGSQFVWVPVGSLRANGTLDGENFLEKLGKRKYKDEKFGYDELKEPFNEVLLKQLESTKKHGGFYISRYNISKSLEGKPQSIKGVKPWVRNSFYEVERIAAIMEDNESVKSHLIFGVEYDSIVEWIIETKVKTLDEIIKNFTEWGNYFSTTNSPKRLVETGSREKWCVNNIYDLGGNVLELTHERDEKGWCIVRGGCFHDSNPIIYRDAIDPAARYLDVGFRVALYIK